MKDILFTTTSVLIALCAVNYFFAPHESDAFVPSISRFSRPLEQCRGSTCSPSGFVAEPFATMRARMGAKGVVAFGMGFGFLLAATRAAVSAQRMARRAEKPKDLAVVEKFDLSKTYLANLPRTVLDEKTLHKLLSTVPKDKWDNPPEDSYLFMLKMYAETYGDGKASKMGWWDYWYMRLNAVESEDTFSGPEGDAINEMNMDYFRRGVIPMWIPGPSQLFPTGMTYKWRGDEPFAGDQVQTPVNGGKLAKDFVKAWAFYRDGLKPWQRGLEIGLAHGYFLIGPFTSLGMLRNTPEAATVGLLSGIVCIGAFTSGGLIYGKTVKPTLFDKDGDEQAAGFNELVQWHGAGGIGGAAFAHALISVFGS